MEPTPRIQIADLLQPTNHPPVIGRQPIIDRLLRIICRQLQPHAILTGPAGSGKTAVIQGLIQTTTQTSTIKLPPVPYLALSVPQLESLTFDEVRRPDGIRQIVTAVSTLPPCVLVIDGIDALVTTDGYCQLLVEIYRVLQKQPQSHLILTMNPATAQTLAKSMVDLPRQFETITLPVLEQADCETIIRQKAPQIAARYQVKITTEAITALSSAAMTIRSDIALPQRALQLFDDVCAATVLQQQSTVTVQKVQAIIAQRTGMPSPQLNDQQQDKLKKLPEALVAHVRGQDPVVQAVAQTIQRSWLGLKDPRRPLGSFLFLGPSGVGKTELAKVVAREVYGSERSLIRFDMSEFGESHMVQRLIGAPPGYVGYESGGQLTNPVSERPFSLVLLDEIEKAHPAIFDIFLQVLDDGRLTDGQGQTVDFTKTIIMATSNLGLLEIVEAWEQQVAVTEPDFLRTTMTPLLLQHFRAEFLNRFEGIHVFAPLSPDLLVEIAQLELQKISQRLSNGRQQFTLAEDQLRTKISQIYDPRLGARPLKRWLEQMCENSLAQRLLTKTPV